MLHRGADYISSSGKTRRPKWVCRCDCGNVVNVIASNLKRGTSTSCGCAQIEQLRARVMTHGGYANNEKLYNVWHGMRKRCYCATDNHYPDYGGRGISICDEWNDYAVFREWAVLNGYKEGLSIDRIDVNGDYSPDNCRWADNHTQQNNKRCCIYFTNNGDTKTLKEWSRACEIPYATLYSRYKRGWGVDRMLNNSD